MNHPVGFAPYGFYGLPPTPDMTAPNGAILSNSTLVLSAIESIGQEWARGSYANAILNGNTFITLGGYGFGNPSYAIANPTGGTVQPQGLTSLYEFAENTMIATRMGAVDYYGVNPIQGVIVTFQINGVGGDCNNNTWRDDPYILGQQGVVNIPPLVCPGGINNDIFSAPQGDGYFAIAYGNLMAGDLLSRFYISNVEQFNNDPGTNSGGFAGVGAETMANGLTVPVITKSPKIVVPQANTAVTLNDGAPVFATSIPAVGVDAGVDSTGAIGNVSFCGAPLAAGLCAISLDPNVVNGSHGANPGVSAAGTTVGTATALTSLTNVLLDDR